jgi:GNAT superfamily N-acetyltransferase
MDVSLRLATEADKGEISSLIARSARGLSQPHYTSLQVETALSSAFGVDSQLIKDHTYFLAFCGQQLAGCGGWSYRDTLFGSDREKNRSKAEIDPKTGAARIRVFFIHPDFARLGLGSLILDACEIAAWNRGYRKLQLMATLPGTAFYQRHGYTPGKPLQHALDEKVNIEFVPMFKTMAAKPAADPFVQGVL